MRRATFLVVTLSMTSCLAGAQSSQKSSMAKSAAPAALVSAMSLPSPWIPDCGWCREDLQLQTMLVSTTPTVLRKHHAVAGEYFLAFQPISGTSLTINGSAPTECEDHNGFRVCHFDVSAGGNVEAVFTRTGISTTGRIVGGRWIDSM